MPDFDYAGAKQAGYSDEEIGKFLAGQRGFDFDGAISAGYNPNEIISFLAPQPATEALLPATPTPTTPTPTTPTPQRPIPARPEPVEANLFREVADIPLNLASGVVSGVEIVTNVFGADNPVSESLRGVKGYIDGLLSAQAKADQQEVARIMAAAEDAGVGQQVKAALRALTVSPLDFVAQGLGTVIPGLAASIVAGVPGILAYGASSGVGLVKGAIYDAVEGALKERGVSEEEAKRIASDAQSYAGDNLDMIALGGVFGAIASRFGIEPKFLRGKLGDELVEKGLDRGVVNNLVRGVAAEGSTEGAQAAQERFAQNLALTREDIETPLGRGVAGQAALEGIIGGILGGGFGVVEAQRADTAMAELRAEQERQRAAREAGESDFEVLPEWAPVVDTEAQIDIRRKASSDEALEKMGDLMGRYGAEAASRYARALMDAGILERQQPRPQPQPQPPAQPEPVASVGDTPEFQAEDAEQAERAGRAIAARMAAEQAAREGAQDVPVDTTADEEAAAILAAREGAQDVPREAQDVPRGAQDVPVDTVADEETAGILSAREEVQDIAQEVISPSPQTQQFGIIVPDPTVETVTEPTDTTKRGRGRPAIETTQEQQEKKLKLSTEAVTLRKRADRAVSGFKTMLDTAVDKLFAKKQYAGSFPTVEEYEAYAADPRAAYLADLGVAPTDVAPEIATAPTVEELVGAPEYSSFFPDVSAFNDYDANPTAAYKETRGGRYFELLDAGRLPEAAMTEANAFADQQKAAYEQIAATLEQEAETLSDMAAQETQAAPEAVKTARRRRKAFNAVQKDLNALRDKRITDLADVLRVANDNSRKGTKAHTTALEILNDPRVTPEERAQAEKLLREGAERGLNKGVPKKPTKKKGAKVEGDPKLVTRDALTAKVKAAKTAGDAARALAADPKRTVFERALAGLLAPLLDTVGANFVIVTDKNTLPENLRDLVAGIYDPATNTVYLDATEGADVGTALHEFVHVASVGVLDAFYEDRASLPKEVVAAVETLQNLMLTAGVHYGDLLQSGRASADLKEIARLTDNFENLKEFLAYGLTASSLQEMMLNMPPTPQPGVSVVRTLFTQFADAIRGMLGMPRRQLSAFEQLIDLTGRVTEATAQFTPKQTSEVVEARAKKQKISRAQKELAKASNFRDFSNRNKDLFALARNPKDALAQLNAFWDAVNEKTVRGLTKALTTNMLSEWAKAQGINAVERIAKTMDDLTVYRSKKFRDMAPFIENWEQFALNHTEVNNKLNDLLNISSQLDILIYDVEQRRFVSLSENVSPTNPKDTQLANLRFELQGAKKLPASREKDVTVGRLESAITKRTQEIVDMYKQVDAIRAKDTGAEAMRIYAKVLTEFRNDLNEHFELLTASIETDPNIDGDVNNPNSGKAKLLAQITNAYQEMRKRRVYVPLMRFGPYMVRVYSNAEKNVREELRAFETLTERNLYLAELEKNSPEKAVDLLTRNDNGRTMRSELQQDSALLRNIFKQIDDVAQQGSGAADALKDTMYQMYLMTLPEGNIRKNFMRREGVTGFNNDTLRAYITTKLANINQLSRLKFDKKLNNQIDEARASLSGQPQNVERRKKEALIDEVAMRAASELNPPALDNVQQKLDYASRMGTKVGFLWLLSSARSALIQPSQLVMFGFPVLHAEYSAGKTAAMATKYLKNFMSMKALGRHRLGENGEVINTQGEYAMRNSSYVESSDIKDALQKAYDYADLRNIFVATRIHDISGRADPEESVTRTSGTKTGTVADKASKFVYSVMTGPIHHLERLSREVFYMSAFELEYEQQLARGVTGDAAIEAAAEKAIQLTHKGMFNYSSYNKPMFAKQWWGRMGYQFKTFQFQAIGTIVKNFYWAFAASGLTKAEKQKAATVFFDIMAFGSLFGGITGTIGYTAYVAFVDGLRDALRPDFDDEDADLFYDVDNAGNPLGLRSFDLYVRNNVIGRYFGPDSSFAKQLGLDPETAELLARGVELGPINALTDWNAQSSLSLDGLFFGGSVSAPDRDKYEDVMINFAFDTTLGAFGSVLRNFVKGAQAIADEGDLWRGMEFFAPAAFKKPMEAIRFAEEGNITRGGKELKPAEYYTAWKLIGQGLGFGSTEVAESQTSSFLTDKKLIQAPAEARQKVYRGLEKALDASVAAIEKHGAGSRQAERAQAELMEVLREVQVYNYRYFYEPITMEGMSNSMRERMRRQALTNEALYIPQNIAPFIYPIMMESRREPLR
jgi:hypothetical protein